MKSTETEVAVFRAIAKGIGIYQLVIVATNLTGIIFEKADIQHVPIGNVTHQGELIAWAIFHSCMALVFLFGTDTVCRLAFPHPIPTDASQAGRQ